MNGRHWLSDLMNELCDILGCTRSQAARIVLAARKEGYYR